MCVQVHMCSVMCAGACVSKGIMTLTLRSSPTLYFETVFYWLGTFPG